MDGADTAKTLPLAALHAELGAKFVPFAGWSMPVQYGLGVMGEHTWTREKAGLFDVSHMGQVLLPGDADATLETLVPVDVMGLASGRQRYGFFTNANGGVLDDLMIARWPEHLFLVVNAGCRDADIAHLRAHIDGGEEVSDRALLALQGPQAVDALAGLVPAVVEMRFMDSQTHAWNGADLWISRSGYTGEDGFEISCPADMAQEAAELLLAEHEVEPVGLGARDSLRLEAGLCLYGHDIDVDTSPVEAGLSWAISKRRRQQGGFPGASVILGQLTDGPARRRVGLRPAGRAPVREGADLLTADGAPAGVVTSGGFGPSVNGPVAMGYVRADLASPDTGLQAMVRGKALDVTVCRLPFIEPGYKRA